MEKITTKIVQRFITNKIIVPEDKELYEYCLLLMARKLIFILTLFITSLLFQSFIQTFIFYITFSASRYICGGYHAKSSLVCFIFSYSIVVFYFIMIKFVNLNYNKINICMIIISVLTMIIIDPIECKNKPFSPNQKKYLPIISRLFIFTFTLLSLVNFKYISTVFYFSIWYGIFSNSILIIIAKNKERRIDKANEKTH